MKEVEGSTWVEWFFIFQSGKDCAAQAHHPPLPFFSSPLFFVQWQWTLGKTESEIKGGLISFKGKKITQMSKITQVSKETHKKKNQKLSLS